MTTPEASVTVNRTGLGVSPFSGGDVIAVVGPAASGAFTPFSLGSSSNIRSKYGRGPMPQLATFIREAIFKGKSLGRPIVCVRTETSTPGSCGTIDVSAFTGTAEAAITAQTSDDDYQIKVLFDVGTTAIGTAGAVYRVSKDNGLTYTPKMALGTSSAITIPNSGGIALVLNPVEAEFVALVVNLRVKVLAHLALAGSVHLAADTTSGTGIGSAPTTFATAHTVLGQLRAALILHAANLTAHTAADTTSFASLPAVGTNNHEDVDLMNAIAAAYAVHRVKLSSVHGAADSTNVVTVANATHGSIVAGDVLAVEAAAPASTDEEIDAALVKLQATGLRWDMVVLTGAVTSTATLGVIKDRVVIWEAAKKYRPVLVNFRLPEGGEDAADYRVAWKAVFDGTNCDAINAGYDGCLARSRIDNLARYRRPAIWAYAAAAVAAPPGEDLAFVDNGLGALPGVSILDDNGNALFHDEENDPGPDDDRAVTLRTVPGYPGTFITNPKTLAASGEDLWLLQYYRCISKAVATAHRSFTGLLSMKGAPDPETGLLADNEVEDLQTNAAADQTRDVVSPGWAVKASAVIDNTVNLFETPEIPVEVEVIPYLYIKTFKVTVGLKNPFKTA